VEFLTFKIYAPLASWGQSAVGGVRPTSTYPSRSALLGLVGAALGIERHDSEKLSKLAKSIQFGVKEISSGDLVVDFHTIQSFLKDKNRLYSTRKDELSSETLNTVLSSREYRSDGQWNIAIWLANDSYFSLKDIKIALLKPKFLLYLGRKSCPLAYPLLPKISESQNIKEALDTEVETIRDITIPQSKVQRYFWEGKKEAFGNDAPIFSEPKRDEPLDRKRWQFSKRMEHSYTKSDKDHEKTKGANTCT